MPISALAAKARHSTNGTRNDFPCDGYPLMLCVGSRQGDPTAHIDGLGRPPWQSSEVREERRNRLCSNKLTNRRVRRGCQA
jgi:hypothetical protein